MSATPGRLRWLGHSTALLEVDGDDVLVGEARAAAERILEALPDADLRGTFAAAEAVRRLLRTDEAPQAPKALNVPREAVKPIHVDLKRPVMPKLKPLPRIKVVRPKALAGKKVKVTLKRVKARR